jgi:hypothetical protein
VRALRILATAALAALLIGGFAAPAAAYPPVDVVHTAQVQVGPYPLTVGFSTWPIRAMRSLDFTFAPAGGIAGKSGTLDIQGAGMGPRGVRQGAPLVRHPRKRDVWGLDTRAIDDPGTYSFQFTIDGPQGHGEGTLDGVTVLNQPGPPLPLSWSVASLPLIALLALIVVGWRRTHPGRGDRLDALLAG